MEPILIATIVIGFVTVIYFVNKKLSEITDKQNPTDELLEYLKTTNTRLDEQNKNFSEAIQKTNIDFTQTLQKSNQDLNERLDKAAEIIGKVQKNIGEMSEIGRGMQELQQFLQSPKLRGNIGEEVLKDLIEQAFPKGKFHLQYSFKSGNKVDAAIKTAGGIIPIDSKFPMENFQKIAKALDKKEEETARRNFINDVRKHIRDISGKYILPEEGTMDFALMYVPSEPVYYEIVNDVDLTDYARKHRIYPVSPTTLYAHFQMILLSFEGQKIEERSRLALRMVRAIQKDYEKVEDNLSILQKHMTNAYNMLNNVSSSFMQLGQKITNTQSLGDGGDKKDLIE